eukprot:g59116.t1
MDHDHPHPVLESIPSEKTYLVPSDSQGKLKSIGTRQSTKCLTLFKSLSLCVNFLGLGLVVGMLGAMVPDLAYRTGSNEDVLALLFTARSIGYLLGSGLLGYCIDYLEPGLLNLLVITCGALVTVMLSTVTTTIYLLTMVITVQGFFFGGVDTLGNCLMIEIHGEDCNTYMQALHLSFAIGAFLGPFSLEPFLSQVDPFTHSITQPNPNFTWAFVFGGLAQLPAVVIQLCVWSMSSFAVLRPAERMAVKTPIPSPATWGMAGPAWSTPRSSRHQHFWSGHMGTRGMLKVLVVLLTSVFLCLYVGAEHGFQSWIYSYSIHADGLASSTQVGAYLNSGFWFAFAVGRALAIPFSMLLEPSTMLWTNMIGCEVALIILLVYPNSLEMFVAGTVLLAVCMASAYPTAISLSETYVDVTGYAATCYVFGSSVGQMAMPLLIGVLMSKSVLWFTYVLAVLCTLAMVVLYALWYTGHSHPRSKSNRRLPDHDPNCNEESNEVKVRHFGGESSSDNNVLRMYQQELPSAMAIGLIDRTTGTPVEFK